MNEAGLYPGSQPSMLPRLTQIWQSLILLNNLFIPFYGASCLDEGSGLLVHLLAFHLLPIFLLTSARIIFLKQKSVLSFSGMTRETVLHGQHPHCLSMTWAHVIFQFGSHMFLLLYCEYFCYSKSPALYWIYHWLCLAFTTFVEVVLWWFSEIWFYFWS